MTIIKTFDSTDSPKRFPKKYIVLTLFCLLTLTVVEIWASNTVVTYGDKFESLSKLSKSMEMENQILENVIAKDSSLNNIASKSSQLGFIKTESIQYIR